MKNRLFLIFIVLFLTGCSVEYSLEFNDDNLEEKISIGPFDSNEVSNFEYLTPYAIINNDYEEFYEMDYSNKFLNLKYVYSFNKFKMSEALEICYDLYNLSYDDDYYYILTSKEFKCMSYGNYAADEVIIKFKSNHDVVSANADYVEDETYFWIVNNDNFNSREINIKLLKDSVVDNVDNNKKNIYFSYLYIILFICFMLIGVYIYIKKKNLNVNKI